MERGTVKFYYEDKGYGFIKSESGHEVFVRADGLLDQITENDVVTFDLMNGEKGLLAVNVKLT